MKTPTLAYFPLLLQLVKAYTGDMTFDETGLGSYDSNAIVALSTEILANGANPNNNPKCGTLINIYNPATRKTHSATIVDTCKGCSTYDIDVSPSVFEAVDPNGLGDGRITVDWGGSAVGEKKMRMMARGEAA